MRWRPPMALLLPLLLAAQADASPAPQRTVYLTDQGAVDLTGAVSFLEDRERSLDIQQVSSEAFAACFQPTRGRVPNYGVTDSALWFRLRVENRSGADGLWTLSVDWPRLKDVRFYTSEGDSFDMRRSGWLMPYSQRDVPDPMQMFGLPLRADEAQELYLRVTSDHELIAPLSLESAHRTMARARVSHAATGVFYGALNSLAIFSLVLFAMLRRSYQLYFAGATLSFVAWNAMNSGHYGRFELALFSGIPWPVVMAGVWAWFRVAFTRSFLRTHRNVPRIDALLKLLQWALPLAALGYAISGARTMPLSGSSMHMAHVAVSLWAALACVRLGVPQALPFLIAHGIFGLGLAMGLAIFSGLVNIHPILTGVGVLLGSLAELFVLAYALALNVRTVAWEREQAMRFAQEAKLDSLHGLVAGVTHELNTPLGALRSSQQSISKQLGLLTQQGGDTSRAQHKLQVLESLSQNGEAAVDRIDTIVHSLRSFAHLDESEEKPVDLHHGLDAALVLLGDLIEKKHVVIDRHYGPIGKVRCRPAELNQVFMTILRNAIEACDDKHDHVVVTTSRAGGAAVVRISDQGRGMSPAELTRLFEPKLSRSGGRVHMGLGLPTSYTVVRDHGGRLEVESREGHGTSVSIRIPLAGNMPP